MSDRLALAPAALMGVVSRAAVFVAALAIAGPAMAQTTDQPDALQPYQRLALGSIPSSATVRDLGDGTKFYDFTDNDGAQVRCALYDLAGDVSLMSCEREPQVVLSKTEAGYRAPDHRYPCMMCRHFDGYRGACSVVAGTVRPDATCDHWRTAEDVAAERRGFAC